MNHQLQSYIESQILSRYASFDAAHRMDHAETVIRQSLWLADVINHSADYVHPDGSKLMVNEDMVYTIAAYHDTGLAFDRATHHTHSAEILRADRELLRWFTPDQIATMADAAEDHRASAKSAPRTIYGRIVAEADRAIEPMTIIRRTIQYGLAHYPGLDKEQHWQRTLQHMHEKYADGGYLKLWIPESPNAQRLAELRTIIRDEQRLREAFDAIWPTLQSTE